MSDTINISQENLEYFNKIVEERKAADAQAARETQLKTEYNEEYQKLVSQEQYKSIAGKIEAIAKEKDYSKLGKDGIPLLIERVNLDLEKERIKAEAEKSKPINVDEGVSVDRKVTSTSEPEEKGGIPVISEHIIDFTKVSDENVDPKILKTVQRIRDLQSGKTRTASWNDGKF